MMEGTHVHLKWHVLLTKNLHPLLTPSPPQIHMYAHNAHHPASPLDFCCWPSLYRPLLLCILSNNTVVAPFRYSPHTTPTPTVRQFAVLKPPQLTNLSVVSELTRTCGHTSVPFGPQPTRKERPMKNARFMSSSVEEYKFSTVTSSYCATLSWALGASVRTGRRVGTCR